jgi:hypothetical protein
VDSGYPSGAVDDSEAQGFHAHKPVVIPRHEAGRLVRRDYRGCAQGRGLLQLSSRPDQPHAEKGAGGRADQATAQRCQQRQRVPAEAAADHARVYVVLWQKRHTAAVTRSKNSLASVRARP